MNAAIRFVTSEPWAMTADALRVVATVARRQGDGPEAVAKQLGRPLDNTHKVTVRDGVGIIPVRGPISRYANLFCQISGGTSIDKLATDIGHCLANPNVRAILLEIDSPGGQANGIAEMASMIREGTKVKPICAYCSGTAASAAYWLASAAEEVVVSPSAIVGSIGVILAMDEDDDDGEIRFVSSQSPRKDPAPSTEAGKAQIQEMVDSLAQVFVDAVASYRGVKPEEVISKFGEGGVKVGADAVKCGMADRVGSFEACVSDMSKGVRPSKSPTKPPAKPAMSSPERKVSMNLFERLGRYMAASKPAEFVANVDASLAAESPDAAPRSFTAEEALAILRVPMMGTGPLLSKPLAPVKTDEEIEAEINKRAEAKAAELSAKTLESRVKIEAKTFIGSMVKAERILPTQAAAFEALYVDAAIADHTKPLTASVGGKADSSVSRLEFFTTAVQGTPKHGLTTERTIEDPEKIPDGLKLWPNAAPETKGKQGPTDPAKLAKLLAMTDEGQAALKDIALANAK